MEEVVLLRASEVAAALKVSRSKVYELLGGGVLPSLRVGRSIRIPKAALERWITAQTRTSE